MGSEVEKGHSSNFTLNQTTLKPWKHIGYRKFCEIVASENDFFILRRFSTLTARILLALQDELSELECELGALEDDLCSVDAPDIHNGSFRHETSQERVDLIHAIHTKLRQYHELAIQHSELRARAKVPKRNVASIANWFYNHEDAILKDETKYIEEEDDLFAIVPKHKTPLRLFLERSSRFRLSRLWRSKSPPTKDNLAKEDDAHLEDTNIHYSSDHRIDLFVALIITILGLLMLIVPLWILAYVSSKEYRLGIITLCVGLFLCFVSFATAARPFESLGSAAAYAAVLIVFLQIAPG